MAQNYPTILYKGGQLLLQEFPSFYSFNSINCNVRVRRSFIDTHYTFNKEKDLYILNVSRYEKQNYTDYLTEQELARNGLSSSYLKSKDYKKFFWGGNYFRDEEE